MKEYNKAKFKSEEIGDPREVAAFELLRRLRFRRRGKKVFLSPESFKRKVKTKIKDPTDTTYKEEGRPQREIEKEFSLADVVASPSLSQSAVKIIKEAESKDDAVRKFDIIDSAVAGGVTDSLIIAADKFLEKKGILTSTAADVYTRTIATPAEINDDLAIKKEIFYRILSVYDRDTKSPISPFNTVRFVNGKPTAVNDVDLKTFMKMDRDDMYFDLDDLTLYDEKSLIALVLDIATTTDPLTIAELPPLPKKIANEMLNRRFPTKKARQKIRGILASDGSSIPFDFQQAAAPEEEEPAMIMEEMEEEEEGELE